MKAKDDYLWAQQVSDLKADGEAGQNFLTFFTFWFDAAEKMMTKTEVVNPDDLDTDFGGEVFYKYSPTKSVRKALELAEHEFGFLSVDLIGQMLTVASMHWAHGDQMMTGLTFIERRVVEEALARKIADLQNQAAETSQ